MTSTTDEVTAVAPPSGRLADILQWTGLAARLTLGGVLLYAGAVKLPALESSVLAVRAYKLLPYDVTALVGYGLPVLEVTVGLLLMAGLFTRPAALAGAALMAAFVVGISWAWAHGYSIDCGCFGGGGQIAWEEARARFPVDIARDVGLFLCGAFLVWQPRTKLSVDGWLFRPAVFDEPTLTDDDPSDDSEETAR